MRYRNDEVQLDGFLFKNLGKADNIITSLMTFTHTAKDKEKNVCIKNTINKIRVHQHC